MSDNHVLKPKPSPEIAKRRLVLDIEFDPTKSSPDKWPWPTTMRAQIAGNVHSFDIKGVKIEDPAQDTRPEPTPTADRMTAEEDEVRAYNVSAALKVAFAGVVQAVSAKEAVKQLFGADGAKLAEATEDLRARGGVVTDCEFLVGHIGDDETLVEEAFDSDLEPAEAKSKAKGPIIARLSAGEVSEVAYPLGYDGPEVVIHNYDQGSGLTGKAKLPSGYARDIIGVYRPESHPVQ